MPRTQPQPQIDTNYHRLPSFHSNASARLTSIFREMDRAKANVYVNTPEMREWIFSCFEYPEQIAAFLNGTGAVPNLKSYFRHSVDGMHLSMMADELRAAQNECLPTHAPCPNNPTDPFLGVEKLWLPESATMVPLTFQAKDNIGKTHPIVVSQLITIIHEPDFSGECNFMVLSRPPLAGPWNDLTTQTAITWTQETLSPLPGSQFRVFLHHAPEHGEIVQYRGSVVNAKDVGAQKTCSFDKYPGYRPPFIDHSLIQAVNNHCVSGSAAYDRRVGDKFALYLQDQFDNARDATDVDGMQKFDQAHLHHTLRRMRVALNPYQPPLVTALDRTLQ